jgi:hypothetical protein
VKSRKNIQMSTAALGRIFVMDSFMDQKICKKMQEPDNLALNYS